MNKKHNIVFGTDELIVYMQRCRDLCDFAGSPERRRDWHATQHFERMGNASCNYRLSIHKAANEKEQVDVFLMEPGKGCSRWYEDQMLMIWYDLSMLTAGSFFWKFELLNKKNISHVSIAFANVWTFFVGEGGLCWEIRVTVCRYQQQKSCQRLCPKSLT